MTKLVLAESWYKETCKYRFLGIGDPRIKPKGPQGKVPVSKTHSDFQLNTNQSFFFSLLGVLIGSDPYGRQ